MQPDHGSLWSYPLRDGLIGMLNTKTIWASKIHYLNDSKEFALALELASDELTKRIRAATSQDRDRLKLLRDTIYTVARVNTCVCCFSELGDALSQWRGYGDGNNAGFSVGFTREWFTRVKDTLERVMNLGKNRIEMRIPQSAWFPRDLCFLHS